VTGGKLQGASDYSLIGFGVLLDTDRLWGWHGGTVHVGYAVNFGTSLSKNYVGNSFPVQLADVADTHPRLTYFSFTQGAFEGKLSVRLGRLTINSVSHEEFLGSEYFKAFTSVGVDLVPLGLFLNAPGAFGYPDTTWGARIKFQPDKRFYTMVGVYNGDPALKDGTHHGLDFSMRGPPFLIGEAGFRWNDSKNPSSVSRNIKFGAYYNDGVRYGLYVLGDQVLLRWGAAEENRHLGAFGAFISAPDQHVNRVPYFFDTGLVAYGPMRSRPKDFAGFAVVYGSYSRDLRRPEEMAFEWNYAVAIRPGLLVQPDIQYLINPNGNKSTPNALAIGTNIVVNW
jgi:porin